MSNAPERIVVYPTDLMAYGGEVDWNEGHWNIPGYTMVDGAPYIRRDAITPAMAAKVLLAEHLEHGEKSRPHDFLAPHHFHAATAALEGELTDD